MSFHKNINNIRI